MKNKVKILFTFVALILSSASIVTASKSIVSIVPELREKSLWDWAACASMLAKYEGEATPDQREIVKHVKGDDNNSPASAEELIQAIDFASNGALKYEEIKGGVKSEETIRELKHNTAPIYLMAEGKSVRYLLATGYGKMGDTTLLKLIDPQPCKDEVYVPSYLLLNGMYTSSGLCELISVIAEKPKN